MTSKSDANARPWEKFVRAYMAGFAAGDTAEQIAARCETTKGALFVHASALRKQGVRLPRLKERFDAAYLNGIILRAKAKKKREKQTASIQNG